MDSDAMQPLQFFTLLMAWNLGLPFGAAHLNLDHNGPLQGIVCSIQPNLRADSHSFMDRRRRPDEERLVFFSLSKFTSGYPG